MSEPVNPLFEEEKEFLERKKLEYERALLGDVEQLKEQGVQVGKVALVGAGVVGGIWLLSRLFGGRKRRKKRARARERAYDDYQDTDYQSQYFADLDDDDERWTGQSADYASDEPGDYFGGSEADGEHGTVYHTDSDSYDDPTGPAGTTAFTDDDEADDNGFANYPDFPEHSGHGHGAPIGDEASGDEARPFYSAAHSHPEANLPYDDSRRMPEGDEFEQEGPAAEATGPGLTQRLVAFAKSDLGKAVLGQAVSLVAALATKALSERLAAGAADTANASDLAASTHVGDGYAHGHPATPQPAAPDATAFVADVTITREPLA